MFSVAELHLIRFSVQKNQEKLNKRLGMLKPESEPATQVRDDLALCQSILEKLKQEL